jgi:flagellar biogenesis protein FliO
MDRILIAVLALVIGAVWMLREMEDDVKQGLITFHGNAYKTERVVP